MGQSDGDVLEAQLAQDLANDQEVKQEEKLGSVDLCQVEQRSIWQASPQGSGLVHFKGLYK